jgi:hypothetical protein
MSTPARTYRVYCFDRAHAIVTADWLDAATDEEAVAKARARGFGTKCEVWEHSRLVASLQDERRSA